MKVCIVVLNSIWWEPRVRKQIISYTGCSNIDLTCIGFQDTKYDEEMVRKVNCKTVITRIPERYIGKQKSIVKKIVRDVKTRKEIYKAILKQKPDIIHADNLDVLLPAYLAAKKLHCKLIYDSFEINVGSYTGKKDFLTALNEKLEKFLVRRIDLMISVSNAAAEYFQTQYQIPKPMVITNSVLDKEIVGISSDKHDGFEVLNHGQFYQGRGYDIMAEANSRMQEYPSIHFALRGFGVMEEELRATIARQNNADQFIFYPKVRVDELISQAAYSHVGVAITVPISINFRLSVSNKLFEYAAAGLPVIMSDIPEHRYLNNKYHFGIITADNTPEAFKEAVLRLYFDKELYDELAINAVTMSHELSWDSQFSKLLKIECEMHSSTKGLKC